MIQNSNKPDTISTEIERWAYSYWLKSYDRNNMISVLSGYSAYFDASQNAPQDEMVVAGYVSTVEAWSQFETAWRLILAKYDVPFFKMGPFIGKRDPYHESRWQSKDYQAMFLGELADTVNVWTVASVACRMKQALFDQYNAVYELDV